MAQVIPPTLLEKLESLLSPEELEILMNATIEPQSESPETKEETPAGTYARLEREFSFLHGVPITTNEASQRYELTSRTLSRWVKNKLVRVIKLGGGQGVQTTYDEGDIAVLANLVRNHRTGNNRGGPFKGGWTPPTRW